MNIEPGSIQTFRLFGFGVSVIVAQFCVSEGIHEANFEKSGFRLREITVVLIVISRHYRNIIGVKNILNTNGYACFIVP